MVHRKTHKRKLTRRKHRGGYYGFSGQVGTGAAEWTTGSEMGGWQSQVASRAGNGGVQYGRGRRRKSKGKRSTRRKHRGGGKFGGVSASFQGEGVAGMANYGGVSTRDHVGSSQHGAFNDPAMAAYKGGTSYLRN